MSKNEKIKKIINFKYIKKGKDTLQKKAVKALFAFLVLMIGCTMLSRAADSMTIPRIKVDTPKSKTIVDEVKAKGVVAKNREEKISVVEGLGNHKIQDKTTDFFSFLTLCKQHTHV